MTLLEAPRYFWKLSADILEQIGRYLTITDLLILLGTCKNAREFFPASTRIGRKIRAAKPSDCRWTNLCELAHLDCLEEINLTVQTYGTVGAIQIMRGYQLAKNLVKFQQRAIKTEKVTYVDLQSQITYYTTVSDAIDLFKDPVTNKVCASYMTLINTLLTPGRDYSGFYREMLLHAERPHLIGIDSHKETSSEVRSKACLAVLQRIYVTPGVSRARWVLHEESSTDIALLCHAKGHLAYLLNAFRYYLGRKMYSPKELAASANLELQRVALRIDPEFFANCQVELMKNLDPDVIEYWRNKLDFSKLTYEQVLPILRNMDTPTTECSKRCLILLQIVFSIPTIVERARDFILAVGPSSIIIEMIKILRSQNAIKWSDIKGNIGSRSDTAGPLNGRTVHCNVKRWAEESGFIPAKRVKTKK